MNTTSVRFTPAAPLALMTLAFLIVTVLAYVSGHEFLYLGGIPATMGAGLVTADVASRYARR